MTQYFNISEPCDDLPKFQGYYENQLREKCVSASEPVRYYKHAGPQLYSCLGFILLTQLVPGMSIPPVANLLSHLHSLNTSFTSALLSLLVLLLLSTIVLLLLSIPSHKTKLTYHFTSSAVHYCRLTKETSSVLSTYYIFIVLLFCILNLYP